MGIHASGGRQSSGRVCDSVLTWAPCSFCWTVHFLLPFALSLVCICVMCCDFSVLGVGVFVVHLVICNGKK
jgi:hypothetical protein